VVSNAKYRSLREPIPPTVYSALVDGFDSTFTLHLRTWERPEAIIAPVREILHSLDPALPVTEVLTLREEVEASLWQEHLLALLSMIFGAIAALLASIGLYGALDYLSSAWLCYSQPHERPLGRASALRIESTFLRVGYRT
jgi:hypothetical protein